MGLPPGWMRSRCERMASQREAIHLCLEEIFTSADSIGQKF